MPCSALAVLNGTLGFATDSNGQPILDQPLVPECRYAKVTAHRHPGDALTGPEPTAYEPTPTCAHCGQTQPGGLP